MAEVLPLRPVRDDDQRDLVERLREGDPEAIALLYRRHHSKVRAFARRMISDASAAEDVVHDAFVALPRAVANFRMEAKLETFLISIAVNLCRRHLRSAVRANRAAQRLAQREPPPPASTPETAMSRAQLADALRRGLEELSLEHREVFVLCAVEERSSQDVGGILGIPEGTVRTRLFHARKQLRAMFEREGIR